MLNYIKCFLQGKRIIEVDSRFIPQVYEISAGWCGIDTENKTWFRRNNQTGLCVCNTIEEANDRLANYLEYKEEEKRLKKLGKAKIHTVESVPKVWRLLRSKV